MTLQRLLHPAILGPGVTAGLLAVLGLTGTIGAGPGYGLFLTACMLLAGALAALGVLLMTRRLATDSLLAGAWWLGVLGGWCYLWAVAALAGHYAHETLAGRMELRWILFGPAALAALVVLDVGLYRLLVKSNLPTWARYRVYISRERANPAAMRRALVDEVILHRSLHSVSALRWLRHTLIFWGFTLMFATELMAVAVREAFPAFGWTDIWEIPSHPLRLAFDFTYDATGLMVLLGCLLALGWRLKVNGTEEQKFCDTPTTLFLTLVVSSGFVVEGMRIAAAGPDPLHAVSFVGALFAVVLPATSGHGSVLYETLWIVHVLGSCLFIAYVPMRRMLHSCATPMGRLMLSQTELLAEKRKAVLGGLMPHRS
jgi:hypothetical protein